MLTVSECVRINPASTAAVIGFMLSCAAAPSTSTLTPLTPSVTNWPTSEPSRSANCIYGRRRGASSALSEGTLSALVTPPVSRKSDICSATWMATLTWASSVEAPRCGVEMKLGVPNSGDALAGSSTKTSSAAPPTWPESSAAFSATSSISPPRAQLMMRTPFFVLARFSADRMLRVLSVSGVCSVIKSACASNSSSVTLVTPMFSARSGVRNGS